MVGRREEYREGSRKGEGEGGLMKQDWREGTVWTGKQVQDPGKLWLLLNNRFWSTHTFQQELNGKCDNEWIVIGS